MGMSPVDGRYQLSYTAAVPSGNNSSASNSFTLSTSGKFIDRDLRIIVTAPSASYGSGSTYKQVTGAGWANKSSGSNKGTSYNISKNIIGGVNFANGGNDAYFTFSTSGKYASSNITFSTSGSLNNRYSSPSGYVPKDNTMYMCYAMNDGSGPSGSNIDGLVKDGNTWYVRYSSGCYIYARRSGTNKDIYPGDNFRYTTENISTYHSGYWSGTPGRRVWHDGYWSSETYYRLYVNGNLFWDSTSYIYFYAYTPNSSYSNAGDVVYIYR